MKGHPLFEIHCLSWSSTSSERLPILLDPVACVCEVLIEVVTCVQTVKTEGVTALYKGFIPNWLRLGPWNIIVSFYTGIFRCTLSDPTPPWHRGFLFSAGPTCVCVCVCMCVLQLCYQSCSHLKISFCQLTQYMGEKYVRIYTEIRKIEMCIRRSLYFDNFQNLKINK